MKCQVRFRSAHCAAFGAASASRFSPTSDRPSSLSSRTSEAGWVLVTAISVMSAGSRPAEVNRSLQEVGDIQVVVFFEYDGATPGGGDIEGLRARVAVRRAECGRVSRVRRYRVNSLRPDCFGPGDL